MKVRDVFYSIGVLILIAFIIVSVLWVKDGFHRWKKEVYRMQYEYKLLEAEKDSLIVYASDLAEERARALILAGERAITIQKQQQVLEITRAEKQKALDALKPLPPTEQVSVWSELAGPGPLASLNNEGNMVASIDLVMRSNEIMLNEKHQTTEIAVLDTLVAEQCRQIEEMEGIYKNCALELETAYQINSKTERQNEILIDENEVLKGRVKVWQIAAAILGLAALVI